MKTLSFITLTILSAFHSSSAFAAPLTFEGACTSSETMKNEKALADDLRKTLSEDAIASFLSTKISLQSASPSSALKPETKEAFFIHRFTQLLTQRRFAKSPLAKATTEYLLGRNFFTAGQLHLAQSAFTQLLTLDSSSEIEGVQLSALECLLQIRRLQPSFQLTPNVGVAWLRLSRSELKTVFERTLQESAIQLALQFPNAELQKKLVATLSGASPAEALLRGLIASQQGHHETAAKELRASIPGLKPEIGSSWLTKYEDFARLLLSRALYTTKDYAGASQELLKMKRSSNHFADGLGELAWAQLQAGKFGDAVGSAKGLQAGQLKNTFHPEAPMIVAMAFNETCQYPGSLAAVKSFRKHYDDSYQWLQKWITIGAPDKGLYRAAVTFLRNQGGLPSPIGTEFLRSPAFQSGQREINLTMDERERIQKLNKVAAHEVIHLMESIIELAQNLKPRVQLARMKLKQGDSLPEEIQKDLGVLRSRVVHLRRLQASSQPWRKIVGGFQGQTKAIEARLVSRINKDLGFRSQKMVAQLEEVNENLQFVEIEIFSGASQDIIWQNANPDFKKVAERLQDSASGRSEDSAGAWKWTAAGGGSNDEGGEIWEDELGSYTADLSDNCSNKEKYLALKGGQS